VDLHSNGERVMDTAAWLVLLIVTIVTPSGQKNIEYREPMPTVKICLEEAERFLDSFPPLPPHVEGQGVTAACVKKLPAEGRT